MIINKKLLAQYSPLPIPSNYDYSELINYVSVSEEIWIRPVIGEALFDEIEEQVKNNTVSGNNATLMTEGKLLQYLAYAVCLEGLPFIWSHFSQTGISLGKSENSDSITLKDLTYIQQHLRRQVEFLKDSVIKWLDSHWESFPLYVPSTCQCGAPTADKCVCGAIWGKLNHPNKYQQLYTTNRKCTDLR